jgi:class 3 adenylate cyclase/ketosteroid isomerase-like protein
VAVKADPETEAAVLDVLNRFAQWYAQHDVDKLMSLYAPDPDLLTIGTGIHEKSVGPEQLRRKFEVDLAQAESVSMETRWVSVSAADSVAWAACEWLVRWKARGSEGSSVMRETFVLERRDGKWLILHAHTSMPAFNQPEGEAWPTPIEWVAASVESGRPDLRSHAAPDGTVTMLFTDIEGSSTMTERLGDKRWLELLREHNAMIREQAEEHGCFEVKSQGDGFMIASQSARRGIQCAIDIQRAFTKYNETAQEPLQVRIGLHTGEVLKDADDFFGKHVILASRIANEARGSEILVSALLKDLTESGGDVAFGEAREVELKGLAGTYRIHEVTWREGRDDL